MRSDVIDGLKYAFNDSFYALGGGLCVATRPVDVRRAECGDCFYALGGGLCVATTSNVLGRQAQVVSMPSVAGYA